MKQNIALLLLLCYIILPGCQTETRDEYFTSKDDIPFTWNGANVYFLLTDRFNNGDPSNDINFGRTQKTAVNRGFQGGDIKGISQKIEDGYFDELGINAIWLTPFFEQIKGLVDEGTGNTYPYHGYWIRDWTALDPNFGTMEDLQELVRTAKKHDIRIVMDVVINHTGPVTQKDPVWPNKWVRTEPQCTYQDYESTIKCTLVSNLPDIKTESEEEIDLPPVLLKKWKDEGRLEKELEELDLFFKETGYPRAPKYYLIKWLTDYIREFGFSAYRLDTAKHTEEDVWAALRKEANRAFEEWKAANPEMYAEEDKFYMVGEVYNYVISSGRYFNFGDTLVDFFAEGIDHLINFEFKHDANNSYDTLFSKYASILNNELEGKGVMNYISSHDDGWPFDKMRENPLEAGTKLLLCPGTSQIYYGDESSRLLFTPGAEGDANLRSFMNWDKINNESVVNGIPVNEVLTHYQKLGKFRISHPSVGAGIHEMIQENPYIFKRTFVADGKTDLVIIGLDLPDGSITIPVKNEFKDGTLLKESYGGSTVEVKNGSVEILNHNGIILLGLF